MFVWPRRDQAQRLHVLDQAEELKRPRSVVPLEKPTMPLGHDERSAEENRRLREQPAEQQVVAVGSVHERDER
jgi:hypothetical protein